MEEYSSSMFNNIDWFDDIFDIVDVDDYVDDDQTEVKRMIMEDYYEDLNFNFQHEEQQEEEEEEDVDAEIQEKLEEKYMINDDQEQSLSQKLTQLFTEGQKRPLSTPTSSQEDHSKKKFCLQTETVVQQEQEQDQQQKTNQITTYLEIMDEMFYDAIFNSNTISRIQLQLFIECKHQMGMTQLHLKRWTRYLEAGIQQQIWSTEVKEIFQKKKFQEKQFQAYV
ncbi:unnamed protein product, partial [Rotaria sp. Silwood2]